MPEIARFYGIIIGMYFDDHGSPHFHAAYGEFEASVAIDERVLLGGSLPRRAQALVFEWAELHREELLANWTRARERVTLRRIDPLH